MSFTFRPAKRENVPLLIGLAGGTGSGKTFSALRLARGMAAGEPFAIIDTENGRAKHYAEAFPEMRHGSLTAPFRPSKYADAIQAADAEGYPVIVVDSTSHEWAGDGGCLDWHDEIMGGDQKKNLTAWIKPKREHKQMVTRLLQVKAHVILCFRAEPKVEAHRRPDGSVEIVPMKTLTGLDGWLPISEKMLPYELTASFLLMADAPGIPKPIKLPGDLKPFVSLEHPIEEETGKLLAQWARGTTKAAASGGGQAPVPQQEPSPQEGDADGASPSASSAASPVAGATAAEPTTEQSPFVPPVTLAMSPTEFKEAREREGISQEAARAKLLELWPDKGPRDLTNEQRAELWKALVETQQVLA